MPRPTPGCHCFATGSPGTHHHHHHHRLLWGQGAPSTFQSRRLTVCRPCRQSRGEFVPTGSASRSRSTRPARLRSIDAALLVSLWPVCSVGDGWEAQQEGRCLCHHSFGHHSFGHHSFCPVPHWPFRIGRCPSLSPRSLSCPLSSTCALVRSGTIEGLSWVWRKCPILCPRTPPDPRCWKRRTKVVGGLVMVVSEWWW